MIHADHVRLLHDGVPAKGGVWADLGSGGGAFTLALADLLGPGGEIYSIDKDGNALREQEQLMRQRFPSMKVQYRVADFTRQQQLPPLDGILMANALHFHRDKERVVQLVKEYLKPDGRLLLVEYNVDQGNIWVPHPLSYATWAALASRCGFAHTRQLATQPSRFLKEMFSAQSM